MGKINSITKQTDNRYVNLYNVKATSVHNTPVNYFVSSRAKDVDSLKMVTHKNNPDGVIIYSIYGEKHDKVVLIRQYRYTLGDYIYEFPAGLVEPDENYHEGAIREMYEETGLKLDPIPVAEAYQKPYFTTVGMTDESCATVYGYAAITRLSILPATLATFASYLLWFCEELAAAVAWATEVPEEVVLTAVSLAIDTCCVVVV